ncbi:chitin deacetylase [Kappamyces sp. JEL0829]|nr:chitin deacetylase [Kappamyces sp. JEL0829]
MQLYYCILAFHSLGAFAYDFSAYPPSLSPPPPNPAFTRLYNLAQVQNRQPTTPANNAGSPTCPDDSSCSWTCQACFGSNDIRSCPDSSHWGLTYDDGPSTSTPDILKLLESKRARATFFVIGSYVVQHPDILLQTFQAGHQIGIHTWSHRALTSQTTETVVAELEWTARAIEQVIGVRPKYFRPPFGDIDDRVRGIAAAMGLTPVIWNVDTFDWAASGDCKLPPLVTP